MDGSGGGTVLAGADLVDANGRILNVRPARGEPAEYKDVNDHTDPEGWSEKYSVITMMPNPAGPHTILALTGSGSEHPAALAYYLTNPDTAREHVPAPLRAAVRRSRVLSGAGKSGVQSQGAGKSGIHHIPDVEEAR